MPWLVIPAAYIAAGIYYVLRDLKALPADGGQLRGLTVIGLLWLPITLHSVVLLGRTKGMASAAARFARETASPLLLFVLLVVLGFA
ncbi:hypothetical protein ASE66_24220 [Bosea sp. Root483D1]|uniref:hypothetical protein n=1 Tax=Bosea sp. Root483D1 TaxID=1736544 RepID=UPI00070D6DCA|nr:hypothetical protein [Bosea sp. Root483D1]KRE11634.1 hypothetical protein ASE66_24220 [Bosea sp. Root483D1]